MYSVCISRGACLLVYYGYNFIIVVCNHLFITNSVFMDSGDDAIDVR